MHVLIINSEYPPIGGGAGNASANLAKELAALGQDVTVLTTQYGSLPVDILENGVRILRIKSLRRQKDRSGVVEQSIFMLAGILGVMSLLRDWRPDVIVAFFGIPSGVIAWLTQKVTKIPYLVSLRGGDVPGFRPYDFAFYHRLVAPLLHKVWRRAGSVVANSQGLGALGKAFDKQVDIQIIPNGVDLLRYRIVDDRDWMPSNLLWVGRLVYQKGLDILIKSLAGLKSMPWTLNLVGDGSHRPELERMAVEHGIAERIEFMGWLDRDVLFQYFKKANLFVFPSRHEGMPNAILEAMACGLPVIATQISGNEDLIHHGENGLLVPTEDPMALREALRTLLLDAERRKQMGFASRARVESSYAWEKVAMQYLALMHDVIG